MESVCYKKLGIIEEGINKELSYSYNTLDKLKEANVLDQLLNSYDISNCLKKEFVEFLDILDNPLLDEYPYIRKILLHESNFVEIFKDFGYILSLYLNNKECYRVFPLFVKEMINKFNIEVKKDISIEENLIRKIDLDQGYNPNLNKNVIEVAKRQKNLYTDYSKYEEKIKNNSLDISDQTEFFIWAENYTYTLEYNELKRFPGYNEDYIVSWVSKDHGDGYGFDILSYDPILKKQKLIEVKSGRSNSMSFSRNELKVLYKAIKNNCDYYIYRYYYNIETKEIELYKLKYNELEKKFIDINNPNNVFYISPYFYFEDDYQKVGISIEPEKEFKKLKND